MKKILFTAGLLASLSANALENGSYQNQNFTTDDPQMFKSVILSNDKCSGGGFVAHFYGADPINFCVGNLERKEFKYKKCIGKKLSYPLAACIGVQKTVVMTTIAEITIDESTGIITRLERNSTDNEVTFEQEYILIPEKENLKVIKSFEDFSDGRVGQVEYSFIKK